MSYLDLLSLSLAPLGTLLSVLPYVAVLLSALLALMLSACDGDRSDRWTATVDTLAHRASLEADTGRRLADIAATRTSWRAVTVALATGRPDLADRALAAWRAGDTARARAMAGAAVRWAPRPVAVPVLVPVVVPSVPMARPALFTRPLFLLVPVPADRRPAFAPPVAA